MLLSDGAGEVAPIGEGVTRAKIGDRIAGCFHPRWFGGPIKSEYLTDRIGANPDGVLAEYAVFNEEAVVALPNHLSFEGAAKLPCAAVTAWVALTGHCRVTAGDTVILLSNASKWRYITISAAGQTSAVIGSIASIFIRGILNTPCTVECFYPAEHTRHTSLVFRGFFEDTRWLAYS